MKSRKLPLVYPTAGFAGLLFVLGAMWYAASSQNNVAVYLLFFVLTGVFLVSIPHTLVNLAGVTVTLESVQPAFVGQEVSLPLEIMNDSRANRHGIELALSSPDGARQRIDYIPAHKAARVTLRFPARHRGEHSCTNIMPNECLPAGFHSFLETICVFSQLHCLSQAGGRGAPSVKLRTAARRPATDGVWRGRRFCGNAPLRSRRISASYRLESGSPRAVSGDKTIHN